MKTICQTKHHRKLKRKLSLITLFQLSESPQWVWHQVVIAFDLLRKTAYPVTYLYNYTHEYHIEGLSMKQNNR